MQNSAIEWTDHTFNPWRGCEKVSEGCAHCYAEKISLLNPNVLGTWGAQGKRAIAAESYWREPLKWDREAKKSGVRRRVFCASLADVFEDRPELDTPRHRLFDLILGTPNLDWLLLTKRPDVMEDYLTGNDLTRSPDQRIQHAWGDGWPNVWLGVSVENQGAMDQRGKILLSIPAALHFVSVEPLLGPISMEDYLCVFHGTRPPRKWACGKRIEWVIVGGESGKQARPMAPHWARFVRDQCKLHHVPFFFKQWGEWTPEPGEIIRFEARLPRFTFPGDTNPMVRCGKALAGNVIDGATWLQMPEREFASPS